jgi:hypothetical protein
MDRIHRSKAPKRIDARLAVVLVVDHRYCLAFHIQMPVSGISAFCMPLSGKTNSTTG